MSNEIQAIYISFLVNKIKLWGNGYYSFDSYYKLGPIQKGYILRDFSNV